MIRKIQSRERLAQTLRRERRNGGAPVVFTNGCFDLLHVGHLKSLRWARRAGRTLVVALNTDASVRRLKGKGRPLLPLKERLELVASLEMVDYVTWFGEPTPEKTIRLLMPDVVVKGADYRPRDIVGHGIVRKVVRVPLFQGRSTSGLIRKIAKIYG